MRGPNVCNRLFFANYQRQRVADQVGAISEALETPGHAVAIVPLRILVSRDGVIQQLQARCYEITDPASLRD